MIINPEDISKVLAVVMAAISAVTDYLYGKIFNRHILWGLGAAIIMLSVIVGVWAGGLPSETAHYAKNFGGPWVYLLRVLANGGMALAIGFGLWAGGMWAAGDAKLLFVLTLLVPLSAYTRNFWAFYPGYPILFNTFLSIIAILVVELVAVTIKRQIKNRGKRGNPIKRVGNWFKRRHSELWRMVMVFLLLFLTVKTYREVARELLSKSVDLHNNVILYFLLFLLYGPLNKLLAKKWPRRAVIGITLIAATYITIFPHGHLNFYSLIGMSGIAIVIVLFRWMYDYYLKTFEDTQVSAVDLVPGAILSPKMIELFKERDPEFIQELGTLMPDGITAKQVGQIRQWFEKWNIQPQVKLKRNLPFAPALFLGTLITIIFGGFPFDMHG